MAVASPLGLQLPLIVFLLVPGYIALRGYLSATVQIDTTTRTDKILLGIIGGALSLGVMLLLNRFGILWYAIQKWYSLFDHSVDVPVIQFSSEYALRTSTTLSTTFLAAFGFLLVQSGIAYIGAYLYGTGIHVRSDTPQTSDKDLQQPWETALRQSFLGDKVTVVTKNGDRISGTLYRIGSPSKSYDLLLSAAERKSVGRPHNVPLGMTYHNQDDISHVQFDDIEPDETSPESNRLVRWWEKDHWPIFSHLHISSDNDRLYTPDRMRDLIFESHGRAQNVDECLDREKYLVRERILEAHRRAQNLDSQIDKDEFCND